MSALRQQNNVVFNIENKKVGESPKTLGQVFTPDYIIDQILDELSYSGKHILNKTIIEPSFGDGAFLLKIIQRLIESCRINNMSNNDIEYTLNSNIFGIELDTDLYNQTKEKLNIFLRAYGLNAIKWTNLHNGSTLTYKATQQLDFVVGNPPYIRIHNMDAESRSVLHNFKFNKGPVNMYILFFEKCLNMLNKSGKLGFITPNSYLTNTSQDELREMLMSENLVKNIIDFNSYKVFENVGTYTAITILDKQKENFDFTYKSYEKDIQQFVINYSTLDFLQNKGAAWNFGAEENTNLLNLINSRSTALGSCATIQCGIATNKDDTYIGTISTIQDEESIVYFQNLSDENMKFKIEKSILKTVVKCSKYKGEADESKKIIFPYHWNESKKKYEVIQEDELQQKYPLAYEYFLNYKSELENRSLATKTKWYEFGRSQGLNNSRQKKLVISKDFDCAKLNMKVYELNEDEIVYSGIFITCKDQKDLDNVKEILESSEFCQYSKIVGKNMSGNWKNISSNNIKYYRINKESDLMETAEIGGRNL